jgi:hypothetical protein
MKAERINLPSGGFSISERIQINRIVWIRSLPECEHGPSNRMVEDLMALEPTGGIQVELFSPQTVEECLSLIEEMSLRAREGLRPLIHFDCHGSEYGLALENGETLDWDTLAAALRTLNVETRNNLICVLAACFGLNFGKVLSLSKPTPWYIMIAPEEQILIGDLEQKTRPFYESLLTTGSITRAFQTKLEPQMQMFNCQVLFAKGIAVYVKNHASGKALQERREKLLTQVMASRRASSRPIPLRVARSLVKTGLKPGQKVIDHFAPRFLIGRRPAVDYKDIQRIVSKTKASSQTTI